MHEISHHAKEDNNQRKNPKIVKTVFEIKALENTKLKLKNSLFLSVRSNVVIALRGQLVGNPYFMDRRESYSNSASTALRSTYEDKRTSSDSTRSELQSS